VRPTFGLVDLEPIEIDPASVSSVDSEPIYPSKSKPVVVLSLVAESIVAYPYAVSEAIEVAGAREWSDT